MIATTPSDNITDFIAFFEQVAGRDIASDRVGANNDEIERLVQLVRLPLPKLYKGYLCEFGGYDGVLRLADDASAKPSTLIDIYLEHDSDEESEIPEHGVVFGANGSSGERARHS